MTKLSRANLATQDSTVLLQDNTTSDILPSEHRQSNVNIHDSFLSLVDDNIDKDADTSLKYLSDPSGAWDSSPTHDLKLTPKVYVDDALSGYAKLDGSNMPFTGFVSISKSSNDPDDRQLLVEDVSGTAGVRVAFDSKLSGANTELSLGTNNGVSRLRFWNVIGTTELFRANIDNSETNLISYGTRAMLLWAPNHGGAYGDVLNFSNGQPISMLSPQGFRVWSDDLVSNILLFSTSTGLLDVKATGSQVGVKTNKAVVIGDSTTTTAGALRYNTTTNKHQGYNGTTWNDLY